MYSLMSKRSRLGLRAEKKLRERLCQLRFAGARRAGGKLDIKQRMGRVLLMSASLKTLDAVVEVDGTVRLIQPVRLSEPAPAVVTILMPDDEPNEATRQAIEEPLAGLPRFKSVDALFQELET